MIKVTKLTDYATVIAGYLAGQADCCSARQMATVLGLPGPTVQKVLRLLVSANLIQSTQGMRGGYQLNKAASDISVAEIIQAVEGAPALTTCAQRDTVCQRDASCHIKHAWQQIDLQVNQVFQRWTLADLCEKPS